MQLKFPRLAILPEIRVEPPEAGQEKSQRTDDFFGLFLDLEDRPAEEKTAAIMTRREDGEPEETDIAHTAPATSDRTESQDQSAFPSVETKTPDVVEDVNYGESDSTEPRQRWALESLQGQAPQSEIPEPAIQKSGDIPHQTVAESKSDGFADALATGRAPTPSRTDLTSPVPRGGVNMRDHNERHLPVRTDPRTAKRGVTVPLSRRGEDAFRAATTTGASIAAFSSGEPQLDASPHPGLRKADGTQTSQPVVREVPSQSRPTPHPTRSDPKASPGRTSFEARQHAAPGPFAAITAAETIPEKTRPHVSVRPADAPDVSLSEVAADADPATQSAARPAKSHPGSAQTPGVPLNVVAPVDDNQDGPAITLNARGTMPPVDSGKPVRSPPLPDAKPPSRTERRPENGKPFDARSAAGTVHPRPESAATRSATDTQGPDLPRIAQEPLQPQRSGAHKTEKPLADTPPAEVGAPTATRSGQLEAPAEKPEPMARNERRRVLVAGNHRKDRAAGDGPNGIAKPISTTDFERRLSDIPSPPRLPRQTQTHKVVEPDSGLLRRAGAAAADRKHAAIAGVGAGGGLGQTAEAPIDKVSSSPKVEGENWRSTAVEGMEARRSNALARPAGPLDARSLGRENPAGPKHPNVLAKAAATSNPGIGDGTANRPLPDAELRIVIIPQSRDMAHSQPKVSNTAPKPDAQRDQPRPTPTVAVTLSQTPAKGDRHPRESVSKLYPTPGTASHQMRSGGHTTVSTAETAVRAEAPFTQSPPEPHTGLMSASAEKRGATPHPDRTVRPIPLPGPLSNLSDSRGPVPELFHQQSRKYGPVARLWVGPKAHSAEETSHFRSNGATSEQVLPQKLSVPPGGVSETGGFRETRHGGRVETMDTIPNPLPSKRPKVAQPRTSAAHTPRSEVNPEHHTKARERQVWPIANSSVTPETRGAKSASSAARDSQNTHRAHLPATAGWNETGLDEHGNRLPSKDHRSSGPILFTSTHKARAFVSTHQSGAKDDGERIPAKQAVRAHGPASGRVLLANRPPSNLQKMSIVPADPPGVEPRPVHLPGQMGPDRQSTRIAQPPGTEPNNPETVRASDSKGAAIRRDADAVRERPEPTPPRPSSTIGMALEPVEVPGPRTVESGGRSARIPPAAPDTLAAPETNAPKTDPVFSRLTDPHRSPSVTQADTAPKAEFVSDRPSHREIAILSRTETGNSRSHGRPGDQQEFVVPPGPKSRLPEGSAPMQQTVAPEAAAGTVRIPASGDERGLAPLWPGEDSGNDARTKNSAEMTWTRRAAANVRQPVTAPSTHRMAPVGRVAAVRTAETSEVDWDFSGSAHPVEDQGRHMTAIQAGAAARPVGFPQFAGNPAAQVAAAAREAVDGPIEISLHPEELGRLHMTLRLQEKGITLVILADRPETVDLVRRHADELAQEFQEAGYTSVSVFVDSGTTDSGSADCQGLQGEDIATETRPDPDGEDPPPIRLNHQPSDGLDIRL
ncbi:hypothetical protein GLS40_01310 [Pseudooceanicola sp. 216_PA32_1]|uniref:Flagellar hook-length control protein-like C-terminal domain-containing protein n=2 Tax=Pseudooceanicola pacificus TaxID=2676438 RepID=A0A844VY74_9RHOB|nr:hypothetical protein [Pseudooceanicola pacificus]